MASNTWGGRREGAGRPRTTLTLTMPPLILQQYQEVADALGAPLEEVVKEALLSWLSDWQAEHDALPRQSQDNAS